MKTSNNDLMRSMEHSHEGNKTYSEDKKKVPLLLYGGSANSQSREPGPGAYNLVTGDILYEARQGKGTTLKGRNFVGVGKVEDFPGPAAYDIDKSVNRNTKNAYSIG